jgi:rsbT co-antagonist protein RsbR
MATVIIHDETMSILNCMRENICIANNDFELVWMNRAAHQLIAQIKEFIHVSNTTEVIGKNLSIFHMNFEHQKAKLEKHTSHESKIKLFGIYSAEFKLTRLINEQNKKTGYILTWNDITEEEEENQKTQKLIEAISTPILPLAVEHSLLVPFIGSYDSERFEKLQQKLLLECSISGTEYVVFDFSSMSFEDNERIINQIATISETIVLVGAEPIYVGFQIPLIRELVKRKVRTGTKTFGTFKQASTYLLKKKGYSTEITDNDNV